MVVAAVVVVVAAVVVVAGGAVAGCTGRKKGRSSWSNCCVVMIEVCFKKIRKHSPSVIQQRILQGILQKQTLNV